jgi:ATP synthase protein I
LLEKKVAKDDNERRIQQLGAFVTIPFVLSVPPVIGWLIGHWLDGFFGTAPYLMYMCILLGLFAGGREFYRIVKRYGNGA